MFQIYIVEKIKTLVLFYIFLLFSEDHAAYEVMCKNVVKPDTPPITIHHVMRRKRNEIAFRISKATVPFTQL